MKCVECDYYITDLAGRGLCIIKPVHRIAEKDAQRDAPCKKYGKQKDRSGDTNGRH